MHVAGGCSNGELSCLQEVVRQLFAEEARGGVSPGQPRLCDLVTLVLGLATEAYKQHTEGGCCAGSPSGLPVIAAGNMAASQASPALRV
jgi:hypothetical protein